MIRHTRTAVASGVCYGRSNVALADTYAQERAAVLRRVREIEPRIRQIFSSPLDRCLRLATDLAGELQIPLSTDDRLRELDFGTWELQTWEAIQNTDGERAAHWMQNFVDVACPAGESYRDLARRAGDFFAMITAPDGSAHAIAIVAHGGSIRALLAHALGFHLEDSFRLEIEYGRVTCLEIQAAGELSARLLYLNR